MTHDVVLTETLVETLEQFETEDAERIINKLEDIGDFPDHFLDRLKDHPGYKLRVGDFRVLIDWDKDNEALWHTYFFYNQNISLNASHSRSSHATSRVGLDLQSSTGPDFRLTPVDCLHSRHKAATDGAAAWDDRREAPLNAGRSP